MPFLSFAHVFSPLHTSTSLNFSHPTCLNLSHHLPPFKMSLLSKCILFRHKNFSQSSSLQAATAEGSGRQWWRMKGWERQKVLFHDDVSDQMTRANNWKSQKFLSLINVNSESWELKRPPASDDPSISFTVNASLGSGEFARSNLPSRISPLHSAAINFIRE